MARFASFRARLLRWDALLTGAALVVPITLAMILGFVWLLERGYFLWFVIGSITFSGAVALAKRVARWRADRAGLDADAPPPDDGVLPDPGWTKEQTASYRAAQAVIRRRTREGLSWEELQELAREVVETVASQSGGQAKGVFDFTLPEALLLIEQVASQFRGDLREAVPFSDSIRLRTLVWLWQNRARAQNWAQAGYGLWRIVRLVKNPPVGIMQEIDSALAGGHSSEISAEALALGQSILMEEVAKAAVDLYSGRLRFSDAELLRIQQAEGAVDRARLAAPDVPLRIVVAGQVSAGKSSLINALLPQDRAETDAAPTTAEPSAYPIVIGGTDCVLVDLPGLDGSREIDRAVQAELADADMILWVLRADRPSRAVDAMALDRWRAVADTEPEWRMPPVTWVLAGIDRLFPDWPFPEQHLPPDGARRIADVVHAVAEELGIPRPIPASSVAPEWNVVAVEQALRADLAESLMVQRNRARRKAGETGAMVELRRGATGLSRGLRLIALRVAHSKRHTSSENDEDEKHRVDNG